MEYIQLISILDVDMTLLYPIVLWSYCRIEVLDSAMFIYLTIHLRQQLLLLTISHGRLPIEFWYRPLWQNTGELERHILDIYYIYFRYWTDFKYRTCTKLSKEAMHTLCIRCCLTLDFWPPYKFFCWLNLCFCIHVYIYRYRIK